MRAFERELTLMQAQLSPGSEIKARDATTSFKSSVHTVPGEFEKDVFHFRVDGKTFSENRAFRKRWRRDGYVISRTDFFSNINPNSPVIVVLASNSSGVM